MCDWVLVQLSCCSVSFCLSPSFQDTWGLEDGLIPMYGRWAINTNTESFRLSMFCSPWPVQCPRVGFSHITSEVQDCWAQDMLLVQDSYWGNSRECAHVNSGVSEYRIGEFRSRSWLIHERQRPWCREWRKIAVLNGVHWAVYSQLLPIAFLQSDLVKNR